MEPDDRASNGMAACDSTSVWQDFSRPIEERVEDLVSKLTLEEKVFQMVYDAPAIERLGIPAYNW